jgi:hypothetical protein
MRKLSAVIAAITIPITVIAMSGQVAHASRRPPPAPVNATNYMLTCSGFAGKLHFDPPVHSGTGPFPVTVKGGAKGCTAEPNGGGTPVDISIGKVTGSFTIDEGNDQSDCDVFIGGSEVYPATGTITIVWKTVAGTPALSSGDSVIQLTNVVQAEPTGISAPGSSGGISGSGSFTGADGGASDSLTFGGEPFNSVFDQCFSHPGLNKYKYGNDEVPLELG